MHEKVILRVRLDVYGPSKGMMEGAVARIREELVTVKQGDDYVGASVNGIINEDWRTEVKIEEEIAKMKRDVDGETV